MRVVIAGCRDYDRYEEAKEFIEVCLKEIKEEIIILSGKAKGVDALGERYALEKGYVLEYHPAEWDKYGRAAGPMRNRKMAEVSDFVICFWDGKSRGTQSMIKAARRLDKPVKIKLI